MNTIYTNTLPTFTRVKVTRFGSQASEPGKIANIYFLSEIGEKMGTSSCWRKLTDSRHTSVFEHLPEGEYITK
jgi:hypothetical protein